MLLALSLACSSPIPSCGEGQYVTASNECADSPSGLAIEGADLLPACEYAEAGDRLEILTGCADGACNDMLYVDILDALGEPEPCHDSGTGYAFCSWQGGGLHSFFDDADDDLVPDAEATAHGIYVGEGWDGTSEAPGLGLGVSLGCYLEVYGVPHSVEYEEVDGERHLSQLFFDAIGLFVEDDFVAGTLDGLTEELGLFGR